MLRAVDTRLTAHDPPGAHAGDFHVQLKIARLHGQVDVSLAEIRRAVGGFAEQGDGEVNVRSVIGAEFKRQQVAAGIQRQGEVAEDGAALHRNQCGCALPEGVGDEHLGRVARRVALTVGGQLQVLVGQVGPYCLACAAHPDHGLGEGAFLAADFELVDPRCGRGEGQPRHAVGAGAQISAGDDFVNRLKSWQNVGIGGVAALPGDFLELRRQRLFRDGEALPIHGADIEIHHLPGARGPHIWADGDVIRRGVNQPFGAGADRISALIEQGGLQRVAVEHVTGGDFQFKRHNPLGVRLLLA